MVISQNLCSSGCVPVAFRRGFSSEHCLDLPCQSLSVLGCWEGEWGLSGFMEVLVSLDAPEQARRGWFIGMVYRSFGLSLVCIPLSEGAATGKIFVNFCNSETSKIALPLCELGW